MFKKLIRKIDRKLKGRPRKPDPLYAAGGLLMREFLEFQPSQYGILMRLLYLANLIHLGRYRTSLFLDPFEARDMGPVVPRLMRDFFRDRPFCLDPIHATLLSNSMRECLLAACDLYREVGPEGVRAFLRRAESAWANAYMPENDREPPRRISRAEILVEFSRIMVANGNDHPERLVRQVS